MVWTKWLSFWSVQNYLKGFLPPRVILSSKEVWMWTLFLLQRTTCTTRKLLTDSTAIKGGAIQCRACNWYSCHTWNEDCLTCPRVVECQTCLELHCSCSEQVTCDLLFETRLH
jgi:hypothetical protein